MAESTSSNKRIAKNTLLLYARMLLLLVVSLYTSRIVLATLGIDDYGLYNVVGGIVTMFTFISMAMGNSTQRYITFALGKGDENELKKVVSAASTIHLFLALIILVLAETIGLWFLHYKMVIPEGRMVAVEWVYQFSIIACVVSIISVPYNAIIIAHEKMGAFAFISILDAVLKLLIVYIIQVSNHDKLIIYAALILGVNILDRVIYQIYCVRNFEEARKIRITTRQIPFREMTSYAGWSMVGNLAYIGYTQGLNLLLNIFFGPAVNAARGIVVTVQNAVKSFVSNFQTALNPQLIKSYALGDSERFNFLLFASSKFSFLLLWCMILPIFYETDSILSLWLFEVPAHTSNFLKIIMIIMLWDALDNPLSTAISATGDIKKFQIIVSLLLLLNVPVSYILLKIYSYPEIVFFVQFVLSAVAHSARVLLVKRQINIPLRIYIKSIHVPVIGVIIASSVSVYLLPHWESTTILGLASDVTLIVVICLITSILIGLNRKERFLICRKLRTIFHTK